jgi:hypothetical protein
MWVLFNLTRSKQVKNLKLILGAITILALVFGMCYDSRAESPITFSGLLRIRAYGLGGFFPAVGSSHRGSVSDTYADTRLRVNVVFKPNETLEVRWRFQAPSGARWGTTNSNDFGARTIYAYGVIKTIYGDISVGRISSDFDSAGLQTLGYLPTWGFHAQSYIFDRDSENDGIMYRHTWSNGFGLKTFYLKKASTNVSQATYAKDRDYDRFSIEPYYKWTSGGVSLALQYDRNMQNNVDRNYFYSINPAVAQQWDLSGSLKIALHFEAKYSKGSYRVTPDADAIDQEGLGLYGDLSLHYETGDIALAGWWFNGQDGYMDPDRRPAKRKNLVDPGEGFYPFMIFYSGNGFLLGDADQSLEGNQFANHWGLSIMGNHKITDDITINYGLGHFRKVSNWFRMDGSKIARGLGTELDLGLTLNILNNLMYSTKVGVFFPGNYYKERFERDDYDDNIWGWGHELIFYF